jgi:hypothetical protein
MTFSINYCIVLEIFRCRGPHFYSSKLTKFCSLKIPPLWHIKPSRLIHKRQSFRGREILQCTDAYIRLYTTSTLFTGKPPSSRSQWPRGIRLGSAAACLLGLRIRIPPMTCMFVSCKCCVFSGTDLCDGPITCPEESYRVLECLRVIVKPR